MVELDVVALSSHQVNRGLVSLIGKALGWSLSLDVVLTSRQVGKVRYLRALGILIGKALRWSLSLDVVLTSPQVRRACP